MGDRALFDQGLDAADVIPMVVGESDLVELYLGFVDGPQHRISLRGVDHRRPTVLDDEIRVIITQTRDRNHLHASNDRIQAPAPLSRTADKANRSVTIQIRLPP